MLDLILSLLTLLVAGVVFAVGNWSYESEVQLQSCATSQRFVRHWNVSIVQERRVTHLRSRPEEKGRFQTIPAAVYNQVEDRDAIVVATKQLEFNPPIRHKYAGFHLPTEGY